MIVLLIEVDGRPVRRLRIDRFPCRIGRAGDADVILGGWRVARRHAEIQAIGQGFRLVDKGTLAGTWVNGERISEFGPLDERDEIEIAGYRLHVHPVQPVGAPAAPAASEAMAARAGGPASRLDSGPRESAAGLTRDAGCANAAGPEGASSGPPGEAAGEPGDPPSARPPADPDKNADADADAGASSLDELGWRRLLHRRLLQAIDLQRKDISQLTASQLRREAGSLLFELADAEAGLPRGPLRDRLIEAVLD
jgi:pilus assembly protein CpaF